MLDGVTVLTCRNCEKTFRKVYKGGRNPFLCPDCNFERKEAIKRPNIVTCQRCGDTFEGPKIAKYCLQCRPIVDADYARKSREKARLNGIEIVMPDEKKCGHCGEIKSKDEFTQVKTRPSGLNSWCKKCIREMSQRKRDAQPKKPKQPRKRTPNGLYCKVCGTGLVSAQRNTCSNRECDLEYKRCAALVYDSAKKELTQRECKECGNQFIPEYGNKRRKFCSKKCLDRWVNRESDRGGDLNGRARKHLRKTHGVVLPLMYQYLNWRKVLDRDNWVCGICGEQIDRDKKCPDDGSPSVDHIVPLAQGGAHLYSNVQAAHFKCNWMKGDGVHV